MIYTLFYTCSLSKHDCTNATVHYREATSITCDNLYSTTSSPGRISLHAYLSRSCKYINLHSKDDSYDNAVQLHQLYVLLVAWTHIYIQHMPQNIRPMPFTYSWVPDLHCHGCDPCIRASVDALM